MSEDDSADTVLVNKNDDPVLYEITSGAKKLEKKQLKRLLAYYKGLANLEK